MLDDPSTDLPEGTEVELWVRDRIVPVGIDDDLAEDERAALHADIEASLAEADAGETLRMADVLAELRQAT